MTDAQVVDLTPAVVDIKLYRADGWTIPFTFKPGGTPADITGYTIVAQIRAKPDDTDATDLTVTLTAPSTGQFTVSQTAAGQVGYYDIQFTPPGGTKRTYIKGRISVDKDVTRP